LGDKISPELEAQHVSVMMKYDFTLIKYAVQRDPLKIPEE